MQKFGKKVEEMEKGVLELKSSKLLSHVQKLGDIVSNFKTSEAYRLMQRLVKVEDDLSFREKDLELD